MILFCEFLFWRGALRNHNLTSVQVARALACHKIQLSRIQSLIAHYIALLVWVAFTLIFNLYLLHTLLLWIQYKINSTRIIAVYVIKTWIYLAFIQFEIFNCKMIIECFLITYVFSFFQEQLIWRSFYQNIRLSPWEISERINILNISGKKVYNECKTAKNYYAKM